MKGPAVNNPTLSPTAPPYLTSGPGRFISLRTKFVVVFSLILVLACAGMSWYFIHSKRLAMTEQVRDLGVILVKNLAHNVRYGIIIEERAMLEQFIAGVLGVEEVVYVRITSADGQVLTEKSKGTLTSPLGTLRSSDRPFYPSLDIAASLIRTPGSEPTVTHLRLTAAGAVPLQESGSTLFVSTSGLQEETFYDFALPVLRRSEPRLEALALQEAEAHGTQGAQATPHAFGVVQVGLTEVPMQRELAQALRAFLLLTLGIITTGILCTNLLARRIITPLRNLAAGARKVSEGDLSTFVVPTTQDEVGQLTALFNLMTKSLQERDQAISTNLETIRRHLMQLSTINQSSAAITSTLDLDRLLSTVLQLLSENLGFARMVLFLWDSERGVATVGQMLGMPPEAEEVARQLEIPVREDAGFAAELLIRGKPLFVPDIEPVADRISPAVLPWLRQVGISSFVAVPLRSQQRILGYLGADRGTIPCTEEDLELLMTIASHVAVAVDNARAYTKLATLTEHLERRVQERTHELQTVNERLQDHDQRRSKFVSVASHELRTPMTSIKGFIENMLDGLTGQLSERQTHYLQRVKHNVDRLTRIINQLLDWSRLDVGRVDIKPESLQIDEFTRDVVESIQTLAAEKSIRLEVLPCNQPITVRADRDKLEQIIFNLVGNAIKFTPPSGHVTVSCSICDANYAQITVADTGCGIAPDQLPHVFTEFSKVESAMPTSQGAQLGLFITKSLVALHGGQMCVDSQLGAGTKFYFTLPLAPTPPSKP
ncbi:HAMP domain-containing sensor histidine kinase [Nitrospira defluvii]|uniref:histidine kinase n=1 Tax=Nitrospira defluvii TaxID=330214 RepID=A0ABM8QKF5_9BACT|nr:ATP-binding protein [Nitrospira defluvii]CAE6701259.1 Histidine kinase [Nitrospira defluvii]